MENVIKDVGEIWSRLFDHKPFLNGEIKYFLKEFEEKREDREVENLFDIFEKVSDIKESQVDRVKLSSDVHLPNLNANLEVALSMCNRIVEKEQLNRKAIKLQKHREARRAEWEKFIGDMTTTCTKVDQTFLEKEVELRHFYSDLEDKLHITN